MGDGTSFHLHRDARGFGPLRVQDQFAVEARKLSGRGQHLQMPRDEFQPSLVLVKAKHPRRPRRCRGNAKQGQHRSSQGAATDGKGFGFLRHVV